MTITEVLIASTLLGLVVMSCLIVLSQAYRLTRHARMITLAGQIVQSVMEDLRLRNFAEIEAFAAQVQPVSFSSTLAGERFSSSFTQGFALNGRFTAIAPPPGAFVRRVAVTLTVTWTEQDTPYSRTLITHFGEKGLSDYYYVGWAP